ncbi:hypothetical protein E2C01_010900 [Portunus trituberculatus]|uniref:Uncharacterized protein n=1 Tax=Portunus trituberculatus TaxID=210409 RepID=A0A5B7D9Z7_PORTR|nr:hypothetical protein [Portunus trituberculatus]
MPLQKRTQTSEACGPALILPLLKGEPNLRQRTVVLPALQDANCLAAPSTEKLDPASHHHCRDMWCHSRREDSLHLT